MFSSGYFRRPMGHVIKNLMIINAAVFVIGSVIDHQTMDAVTRVGMFSSTFGLERTGVLHGMIWQPVTYMFLHGSFMHLVFNMLGLYFLGTEVEAALGPRRFIQLYMTCGVLGGIGWLLISSVSGIPCVGASAAVYGVVGAFAGMFPKRRITMLVYFVLPVTMTALTLALVFAGMSMLMMLLGGEGVAHSAHLVGLAAGYWYGRNGNFSVGSRGSNAGYGGYNANYGSSKKKWSLSDLKARYRRSKFRVLPQDDVPVDWGRVNAVLDKIKLRGINSLTTEEKNILDRASRR